VKSYASDSPAGGGIANMDREWKSGTNSCSKKKKKEKENRKKWGTNGEK
jgi:hypothetical protein